MNLKKSVLGLVVASTLGALSLPAVAQSGEVILNFGPPPDRYEIVPAPRAGQVWVSGHWRWDGNRHVWVSGYWQPDRPGYVYYPPRWVERDGRYVYLNPRWDRDGDGVPNRYDHRPNNPYRN